MMDTLPAGCPDISTSRRPNDIVAVATVHHPEADAVNNSTTYQQMRLVDNNHSRANVLGSHILLEQGNEHKSSFEFGRSGLTGDSAPTLDVYLPHTQIAKKQFTLIADRTANCWRIQSNTETIATVNGVPLQNYTTRTKSKVWRYPHTVYLDQSAANDVQIKDLKITVYLLKLPSQIIILNNRATQMVYNEAQNVDNRREDWAQSRYILERDPVQVSEKSFRVLERFTGKHATAKLFRSPRRGRVSRDEEFLMMNKSKVDESIVRYIRSTDIGDIPSIITDTYEGFVQYAVAHGDVMTWHPGKRFEMATKMLRRLYPAVAFLHHNNIIHGQLSRNSILVRLVNDELHKVLVVDYSTAWTIARGKEPPREHMAEDGRAIMELVDECCDIWNLRSGPPADARNPTEMQRRTEAAATDYEKVRRVVANFLENERGDKNSERGQKLLKVLAKKEQDWSRAQTDQIHNATRRVLSTINAEQLRRILQEWHSAHPRTEISKRPFMVLSLGHEFLDDLANKLFHGRFDATPRDICEKLKSLEGECKGPWRAFQLSWKFSFEIVSQQLEAGWGTFVAELCLVTYIVDCCGTYPEWHDTIRAEYERCIRTVKGYCSTQRVDILRRSLMAQGCLSSNMETTLRRIAEVRDPGRLELGQTYDVWYHVPSRMFNLTQLHRLATPQRFQECVRSGSIQCENFAEVRGEPKLQGCYAPISLLPACAEALGIQLGNDAPILDSAFPTLDPADFSQVNHNGRIILARTGLVAYASVCRTADQVSHAPKDVFDIVSSESFLPTNFGDMEVLPPSVDGMFNHPRPTHWSKFKAAEAYTPRRILVPKKIQAKSRSKAKPKSMSLFETMLADQKAILDEANPPPPKRTPAVSFDNDDPAPHPKRMKALDSAPRIPSRGIPQLRKSFLDKLNMNFLESPERRRTARDPNQSFTVFASSFGLQDDQNEVNQWLEELTDSDDSEVHAGLTNFRFHHDEEGNAGSSRRSNSRGSSTVKDPSIPDTEVNYFNGQGNGVGASSTTRISLSSPNGMGVSSPHYGFPDSETQDSGEQTGVHYSDVMEGVETSEPSLPDTEAQSFGIRLGEDGVGIVQTMNEDEEMGGT